MKLSIQRILLAAGLVTAVAGVSATALTQDMGHGQHQPHHMGQHHPEAGAGPSDRHAQRMKRGEHGHQQHMAQLKTALKLAPGQEAAWNTFMASTGPTKPSMAHPGGSEAPKPWSQLTTPERLDQMQAMHADRYAQMNRRMEATRVFYASLTAEQQKIFDAQGGGMHHGAMGARGSHRASSDASREGGMPGVMPQHRLERPAQPPKS